MNKVIVIDNFFTSIDDFYMLASGEHYLTHTQFSKAMGYEEHPWPGRRTLPLHKTNPLIMQMFNDHFGKKIAPILNDDCFYKMYHYLHLRLQDDNDKDYPHYDAQDYTLLIYLSKTNLNSGTVLLDDNDNVIFDCKFVQNRAFLFSKNYKHMAVNNHGDSIENGRLTMNVFIDKVRKNEGT